MTQRAHLVVGLLAPLCIATFFQSTIVTELFGSHAVVAWWSPQELSERRPSC